MHALKNVMMVVVESLINKFEEDRMRNKELDSKTKKEHQSGYYTDNCSDSDSSFNQVQCVFSLCLLNKHGTAKLLSFCQWKLRSSPRKRFILPIFDISLNELIACLSLSSTKLILAV